MRLDSLRLDFCKGVYEPREDSYLLAKAVEEHAFGKVLDLGTGTGIQGIVAALNKCGVTFADIDKKALECAKRNAVLNNVDGRFVHSDLFSNIDSKFNTIVFNPPYLDSNGIIDRALDGGTKGRLLIDRFLRECKDYVMRDHRFLLLESSINDYSRDLNRLNAKIVAKGHYFFEELVVLLFR